jgi:hypothetical protein
MDIYISQIIHSTPPRFDDDDDDDDDDEGDSPRSRTGQDRRAEKYTSERALACEVEPSQAMQVQY